MSSDDESNREKEDRDSHDEDESDEEEAGKASLPPVYEQLGATALLYRHKQRGEDEQAPPWAAVGTPGTLGHVPPQLQARMIHKSIRNARRAQARWYYPMDYHVIRESITEEQAIAKAWEDHDEEKRNRRKRKKEKKEEKKKTKAKRQRLEKERRRKSSADEADVDSKNNAGQTPDLDQNKEGTNATVAAAKALVEQWNQANPDPLSGREDRRDQSFESFLNHRSFYLTNEARANMLRIGLFDDDNDRDFHGRDPATRILSTNGVHSAIERQRDRHHNRVVQSYNSYDHAYFAGRLQVRHQKHIKGQDAPEWQLYPPRRVARAALFAQQRTDCADPAYLAPCPMQAVEDVLQKDATAQQSHRSRKPMAMTIDDHNHPNRYGNCLVCVPCPCPPCKTITERRQRTESTGDRSNDRNADSILGDENRQCSWCLLHPIGILLDTLAVSSLILPQAKDHNEAFLKTKRNLAIRNYKRADDDPRQVRNEHKLGDTIRQIVSCEGRNRHVVIVRTSIHVTILALQPIPDDSLRPSERKIKASLADEEWKDEPPTRCWGTYRWQEVLRIDLRSFSSRLEIPSYVPVDVAYHPQYGASDGLSAAESFTIRMKMAVLSHSNRRGGESDCHLRDRNVVHHFLSSLPSSKEDGLGAPHLSHHCTKHVITNLQYIDQIEFTTTHPMILWAVAKSYVAPALTPDLNARTTLLVPRVGLGSSLYTIDLRTNMATFEWSPSATEFLSEGIHSLSGLAVDWKRRGQNNRLWVSSVSAGKVWELDGRTPCRVVNMWSLPGLCDHGGPALPETGLYGAGTILTQPTEQTPTSPSEQFPLLSVGKATDTFGLCLYQRPAVTPRFETQAIECAASPQLSALLQQTEDSQIPCCVCTSSVFALPDVSDRIFTCGLAAIRVPIGQVLTSGQLRTMGCDSTLKVVCAITMTNKGDLYNHTLLESRAGDIRSDYRRRSFQGMPVGTMVIPVPILYSTNENEEDPERSDQREKSTDSPPSNHEEAIVKKKLAGGMNLYLHLTNLMPISGAIATSRDRSRKRADSKKCTVRPYQYADIRLLPRALYDDNDDGGEDNSEVEHNLDYHGVGAKRTFADMVVCRQPSGQTNQGDETLRLPAKFRSSARDALASVLDCFDHDRTARIELTNNNKPLRSDMTRDILNAADSDWEED